MKSITLRLEPKPSSEPPPYLLNTEPMEVEDLPLQVALLTMEIAAQRQQLSRLSMILEAASMMLIQLTTPGAAPDG